MASVWRLALQALSGALVWLATPGLGGVSAVAAVAFVPLLSSLAGLRGWRALAWGLLGGLFYIVPGKWATFANAAHAANQSLLPEFVLVLGFFLTYAAPFAAAAWLMSGWQRRGQPAALQSLLSPWVTGFGLAALILIVPALFPFTPVVLISADPRWIQLADLGGEPLLLGLLLTVNAGLATALRPGRHRATASLLAVGLPLAAAIAHPGWEAAADQGRDGSLDVLALQTYWPVGAGNRVVLSDRRDTAPRSAIELTRAGLRDAPQCQVVVWPEIPAQPGRDQSCERAAALAAATGLTILTTCHETQPTGRRIFPARLYTGDGPVGEHRKSRLIPGFERRLFDSATDINPGIKPGAGPTLFTPAGRAPFAPSICYEIHFRDDLRRMTRQGAQWFAHMANFNVFRSPLISEWDLAMTRLRAVENRRAIVRAVNAGVAGMVLPSGAWVPAARPDGPAATCHPSNGPSESIPAADDAVRWATAPTTTKSSSPSLGPTSTKMISRLWPRSCEATG